MHTKEIFLQLFFYNECKIPTTNFVDLGFASLLYVQLHLPVTFLRARITEGRGCRRHSDGIPSAFLRNVSPFPSLRTVFANLRKTSYDILIVVFVFLWCLFGGDVGMGKVGFSYINTVSSPATTWKNITRITQDGVARKPLNNTTDLFIPCKKNLRVK
jgi:hypothetical protein